MCCEERAGIRLSCYWLFFFAACDARAANVGLKRANVEKSSGENIEHQAV